MEVRGALLRAGSLPQAAPRDDRCAGRYGRPKCCPHNGHKVAVDVEFATDGQSARPLVPLTKSDTHMLFVASYD
jgi:hypothetical protein